ncbi:MAG: hypothetical protein J0I12_11275 [Candidatus Eremiobacteraeota bacterium]|nr:hypothetical protein [Candidatus Eremiobacteraeota bacterium]
MQTHTPNSIVIFDIDGTLANCDHRRHHLEKEPKDWDSFFSECDKDTPIDQVMELARLFFALKNPVFFTGRSDLHRVQTVAWLSKQTGIAPGVINLRLFMRVEGDRRPDHEIKSQMLDGILTEFTPGSIWGVVEDRHSVCQMWVERGVFVFDVAQGKGHF